METRANMIIDKDIAIFATGGIGAAMLLLLSLIAKGFMAYIKVVQENQDENIAENKADAQKELKSINKKLDNLLIHSAQHVTIRQHNDDITKIYDEIRRVHGVSQGRKGRDSL